MKLCIDRRISLLISITIASLVLRSTAHGQESPKPDGSAPLARYFPRKDLVVYAEFDGLDQHREAWTRSAAYRLLNETTTGAMLEHSIVRLLDRIVAAQSPILARGRELVDLGKHLLRSGFAIGINRAGGVGLPRCLALVVRGGATGATRTVLDRFLRVGEGPRNPVKNNGQAGWPAGPDAGQFAPEVAGLVVRGRRPGREPGLAGRRQRDHRDARRPRAQRRRSSHPYRPEKGRRCAWLPAGRTGVLRDDRIAPPAPRGPGDGPRPDQAVRLPMGIPRTGDPEHRRGRRALSTDGDSGAVRSADLRRPSSPPAARRPDGIHRALARPGAVLRSGGCRGEGHEPSGDPNPWRRSRPPSSR